MATHDYIIANASGAAVRADLNNALAAIVSNNSNATEPATTYAYQWWADTTAGQLKLRNSTNTDWVVIQELDGTMLMEDGTAAAPGLSFASDVNTGLFSAGADQLGISAGGVERAEFGTTEVVFNDSGADVDFRVEGDTEANLLLVDAGNDRVGICTSAPTYRLQIGDTTEDSENVLIFGKRVASTQTNLPLIGHTSDDGTAADLGLCATSGTGAIRFYTGNGAAGFGSGSNAERMAIDANGYILFAGQAYSNGLLNVPVSSTSIGAITTEATVSTSINHIRFRNSNGLAGVIRTSGTSTTYATSSDYRIKENVVDITDGITRVKQLAPKRFNFIADADETVDGFLAHEAQVVVPEAVTGTKDEVDDDGNAVMQGIDQSKLVPLLTAALQEAIAKIETLETKVAALEAA
jgi:hypothetical protein